MTDITEVKQETVVEQTVPVVAEKPQTQQAQPEEKANVEDINWRKFRQQREEERKQKEAAEKYAKQKEEEAAALKLAMEALVSKPSRNDDYNDEISDEQKIDQLVEKRLKIREEQKEKERVEREFRELPQRLKSNFRDFDDLCTTENLDYLEYHYPEVAHPYKQLPDSYEKWEGLYKALKKFIPNKNAVNDSKKMEKNLSKPQAMSRPGVTQTGDHAPQNHLTEERRQANYARMQKIMGKGGIG